jgi:hypothetical protein
MFGIVCFEKLQQGEKALPTPKDMRYLCASRETPFEFQ